MNNLPDIFREFDRPLGTLGAWRPLLRQLDDFMNEAVSGPRGMEDTRTLSPAVDLEETDDHYILSFDMPGLKKDDINIEVQGNTLSVSGERKFKREGGEGRTRFVESRYGTFQRQMSLPKGIQANEVEAEYTNGVLTVAVPKAAEAKSQKIKIGEGKSGFFSRLLGEGARKEKEAINVKGSDRSHTQTTQPH